MATLAPAKQLKAQRLAQGKSLIACIRHRDASAAVVLRNVGYAKAAFCVLQQ